MKGNTIISMRRNIRVSLAAALLIGGLGLGFAAPAVAAMAIPPASPASASAATAPARTAASIPLPPANIGNSGGSVQIGGKHVTYVHKHVAKGVGFLIVGVVVVLLCAFLYRKSYRNDKARKEGGGY